MNIAAFVAGYRLGHDGRAPAIPETSLEHELEDVESNNPRRRSARDTDDHDWAWHLIGWTVGQAVAQYELARS